MQKNPKPYRISFEIPGLPKTINAMGRSHWTVKAREARLWRQAVVWSVGRKRPAKPLKWAKIEYVRGSAMPIDHDNLVGSFKHVQDGLIDAGVIENDRFENIGNPEFHWEKAPIKKGYVRVSVEEAFEPYFPRQRPQKSSESTDGHFGETHVGSDDSGTRESSERSRGRTRRAFERTLGDGFQAPRASGALYGDSGAIRGGEPKASARAHEPRRIRAARPSLRR